MAESFIFYRSFYEAVRELDNETFRRIIDAAARYALYDEKPDLSGLEKSVIISWIPLIEASAARRENGKKGGRPPSGGKEERENFNGAFESENHRFQSRKPNKNINDNDNVNDNVNDNEKKYIVAPEALAPVPCMGEDKSKPCGESSRGQEDPEDKSKGPPPGRRGQRDPEDQSKGSRPDGTAAEDKSKAAGSPAAEDKSKAGRDAVGEDQSKFIAAVLDYLNARTGKVFKDKSKDTRKHILARLREGYALKDFERVIDIKAAEWMGTDMEKYLRPSTLFGTKFESYANERPPAAGGRRGNRFNNFQQRAYDYAALERELLGGREDPHGTL